MSAEAKEGFLHKSYHVLFVIYAPIALVSILVNIFSEAHVPYIFSVAFFGAGLSFVLACLMWWKFLKHRSIINYEREAGLPYIIRHQFMLMYLPIVFSSMGVCGYYLYVTYVQILSEYQENAPQRITVLLPINNVLGQPVEDRAQVSHAFGALYIQHPELASKYYLNVIDHRNNYSDALLESVITATNKGAPYVVCAYSEICSDLVSGLNEVSSERLPEKPKVIITLASSMELPLAKNAVYRFYPRNREDTSVLAGYGVRADMQSASFIATDDAFGRNAVKEFNSVWQSLGGVAREGIFLDPVLAEDVASRKINEYFSAENTPDAIFTSLHQPATQGLAALSKESHLLLGVNYPQTLVMKLKAAGANMSRVVVSLPLYKLTAPQLQNTGGLFTFLTLRKLMEVDQKLQKNPELTFDSAWWANGDPAYLSFERDGLDYRVIMRAAPFDDSLYSRPMSPVNIDP